MNILEYKQNYWKQYSLLEKEFDETSQYVTLDNDNLATFSPFYLKLILGIGSEIDNVLKEACGLTGRADMADYAASILSKYPSITTQSVTVENSNITITPFSGWNISQPSQSLEFWKKYNEIKHDRIANYKKASLDTVITALAGLYIILIYRSNELYMSDPEAFSNLPVESSYFILDNWERRFRTDKVKSEYPIFDDSDGGKRVV